MRNRSLRVLAGAGAFTILFQGVAGAQNPFAGAANPIDNAAQWANVNSAQGIYNQMRYGNDIILRSEMFGAIATVSLIIAIVMFMFRLIPWVTRCAEAGVVVPVDMVEFMTPLLLTLLLLNPTGQGFAMQNIVTGTNDLFNSFQSYILVNGGNATLTNGSAVKQANAKSQIEMSIRRAQLTCAATLDQTQRQTCYDDAFNSVSAQLDPYIGSLWAQDMQTYSDKVLLRQGKFANQGTNVGSAAGGIAEGIGKGVSDTAISIGLGVLNPEIYSLLLLVSSSFGVVIGVLQTLMNVFFPFTIALSFAPAFKGSWVRWFTGIFQIFISGLFLRMLVTFLAIISVSGASVSGGLYTVSIALTSSVCAIMAIVSVISTLTGMANNVTSNITNLR